MMRRIYILTLHRSGSTWLQNIISSSGEVRFVKDELNIFEPFRSNTLDKYFNGSLDKLVFRDDFKKGLIFGSFFKKENPELILKTIENINSNSHVFQFLKDYSSNFDEKWVGFKYPCHVSKFNVLKSIDPSAKFIFLHRSLRDIYFSKINDGSIARSKREISIKLKRLYALFYFCYSYLILRKHIRNHNVLTIDYSDLINNNFTVCGQIESYLSLPKNSFQIKVDGKSSSFSGKIASEIIKPNIFEKGVIQLVSALCDYLY